MGLFIWVLVILGFVVALFSWAWILQSFVTSMIGYWSQFGRLKRVLFSGMLLLGLLIALQSLGRFEKYFTVLFY